MKIRILLLALSLLTLTGCRDEKLAEIRFCADIRPHDPCIGEDTVFLHGSMVWAQLLLSPEFHDTAVTGNIYGLQEGKRSFLGTKVHELSEGQTIVMEAISLNECGNYEVEFLDSRGMLLARGVFEVW